MFVPVFFVQLHPYFLAYVEVYIIIIIIIIIIIVIIIVFRILRQELQISFHVKSFVVHQQTSYSQTTKQ